MRPVFDTVFVDVPMVCLRMGRGRCREVNARIPQQTRVVMQDGANGYLHGSGDLDCSAVGIMRSRHAGARVNMTEVLGAGNSRLPPRLVLQKYARLGIDSAV